MPMVEDGGTQLVKQIAVPYVTITLLAGGMPQQPRAVWQDKTTWQQGTWCLPL